MISVFRPYQFRQFYLPYRMHVRLDAYIKQHCPVGDFLTAVLENNLRAACELADDENIENLPAYVAYLYNEAPGACWGSPEKVRAWLNWGNIAPVGPLTAIAKDANVSPEFRATLRKNWEGA